MMFPAEMLVDYLRVYQRKGSVNVGCDPTAYPTVDYINNHLQAYQGMLFLHCVVGIIILCCCVDPNSTWTWKKPLNRLVCFVFLFLRLTTVVD